MQQSDIPAVVQLHRTVLGHTLNARVGAWFLIHLYEQLLSADNNGYGFVYKEQGQVLGFVSVCLDYVALNKRIVDSFSWQKKFKLAWYMSTHPKKIVQFWRKMQFGTLLQSLLPQPTPYVLTLGVDIHQQGKGIGKYIMQAVEDYFRQHACSVYYLDTEEANAPAVAFYKKNGFTVVDVKDGNVIFQKIVS